MLHAVVKVYVANIEVFAQLPVHPKFVAVTTQADRLAVLVEVQQIRAQALRGCVYRYFVERPLCEALLPDEDALHPAQRRQPWAIHHTAVEVERHGERA